MTKQEQQRVAVYDEQVKAFKAQGYEYQNLTLNMKKLNIMIIIFGGLLSIVLTIIYMWTAPDESMIFSISFSSLIIMIIGFILLVVVHELIHGFFFGLFAKRGWKAIQFGVDIKKGVAYCYCGDPLTKGQYLIGSVMPGLILGIIPLIIAFAMHSWILYYLALCMTLGAAGDAAIIYKLITTKFDSDNLVYMDHPVDPGLTVFYK